MSGPMRAIKSNPYFSFCQINLQNEIQPFRI